MARGSIRLLIWDDDPMFLDAVEALLERVEDVQVVGRAANGHEAPRRTAELMPDAITMDINMPVLDGVEATRMIVHYFHVPVAVLTGSELGERIDDALRAGATAHVLKTKSWGDLVPTIRAAVARRPQH